MSPVDYAITYHLVFVNQEEANDWGLGSPDPQLKFQTNKIHIVSDFCI